MYCKCIFKTPLDNSFICINSSKVYCKFVSEAVIFSISFVLIVAKCIVNFACTLDKINLILCINSSKVYCKFASDEEEAELTESINSSKVYCKWHL